LSMQNSGSRGGGVDPHDLKITRTQGVFTLLSHYFFV
jgi:hypothetical protein